MPPLSLLIKPASSLCNLRCKYCFYHSVAANREIEFYGIMSSETLEIIVKKTLEFSDDFCTIAFQGGEPTLAGLDFFRKFTELQMKYNIKNVKINNTIQTNGIVIDDEWAKFLAENKFLVGISLDGPKEIHDANRCDAFSKGSFGKVMKTIALFEKYKVDYNILCVVNSYTARYINKVYNFYKKENFRFLQFIPCLDPLHEKPGDNEYSLSVERFTYFLKTLFDLWYEDAIRGNRISIRYFDNLVRMIMGYSPEVCGMSGFCSCQFVMEADGGVYPCDFYVVDEWRLGNIKEMGFRELKRSERTILFEEGSRHIDPGCHGCDWLQICRGGCRRLRESINGNKLVQNYFCKSYKEFYGSSFKRLQQISGMVRTGLNF